MTDTVKGAPSLRELSIIGILSEDTDLKCSSSIVFVDLRRMTCDEGIRFLLSLEAEAEVILDDKDEAIIIERAGWKSNPESWDILNSLQLL